VRLQDGRQRPAARQAQGGRPPPQPRGAQLSTIAIVLVAIGALLLLLAVGGAIAQRRRLAATETQFRASLEQADRDLAAAHAADNGWDRDRMEAAVRAAYADPIDELALVQVIDNPGKDADQAIFRIVSGGQERTLTLARSGDDWVAA
jgi:hypothetical protein